MSTQPTELEVTVTGTVSSVPTIGPSIVSIFDNLYQPNDPNDWSLEEMPIGDPLEPYRTLMQGYPSHEVFRMAEIVKEVFENCEFEDGYRFMGEMWSRFETTCLLSDMVSFSDGGYRQDFMTIEEYAVYDALPELLRVWRGCGHAGAVLGRSWTTSRQVAEMFAHYSVGPRRAAFGLVRKGDLPLLASAVVRKRNVFAVKLDRQEHEVILLDGCFVGKPKVIELRGGGKPA